MKLKNPTHNIFIMRIFLTLLALISLQSCKTLPNKETEKPTTNTESECPDNGSCTLATLIDSRLLIKNDEFGSLYAEVTAGSSIVLKFEYERNKLKNTEDSGYREVVYLALDPKSMELNLQNQDLNQVGLIFGRFCFCRGQTGWYHISSGNLTIKKTAIKTYHIQLEFKTEEVPQVIQTIDQVFEI